MICAEKLRGLCVENTISKHDVKKRYTRYGRDGERNSMIDYVLVRKELLKWVFDVRAAIGLSGGISDHVMVLCRVKFENVWWKPRVKENSESRIKVEKLIEPNVGERNKEGVRRVFENRLRDVDVEESWTCFKSRILEEAESVCGRRK